MSTVDAPMTPTSVEARALPNTVVFSFVKALAVELSQGRVELPSVPDVVMRLQTTLSNEDVNNDTVVRVVGSEPMLAGKLLTMANSAAMNPSQRRIADLPTAVARVGFNIVRSVALGFAVEQLRKSGEYRHLESQLDVVWKKSVQVAALCRVIARRFTTLNADTALLAGLMHSVGRIYILTRASKQPTLTGDPLTFNSIVRDWHVNVAKALLENWKVADEIVDAVAGHEDLDREARGPVSMTDVLSLAMLLESNRSGAEMNAPDESLLRALRRMQLQVRDCHVVLDESAEEIAELTSALGG
jgi:HD-like signal output (HDOD) protein